MPTTSSHSLPYPNSTDPADVPADIAALAEAVDGKLDAIAPGQITGPTSGQILIANASGVITGTSVTGDVTISNSGVTAIGAGAVGTTELDDDAVTTAKIDDGAVTSAKLAGSSSASPTYSAGVTGNVTARKYSDGFVILTGGISSRSGGGTIFSDPAILLPSGYRPGSRQRISVSILGWSLMPTGGSPDVNPETYSGTEYFGYANIETDGEVTVTLGANQTPPTTGRTGVVYLTGISYHAA